MGFSALGLLLFVVLGAMLIALIERRKRLGRRELILAGVEAALFVYLCVALQPRTALGSTAAAAVYFSPPVPIATPDGRHPERAVAREWWEGIIGSLALANGTLLQAQTMVGTGDRASAPSMLATGKAYADAAGGDVVNAPDGWTDVRNELSAAAEDMRDSIAHFQSYAALSKPTDDEAAITSISEARDEIEQATRVARIRYEEMGGTSSDLDDLATRSASLHEDMQLLTKGQKPSPWRADTLLQQVRASRS